MGALARSKARVVRPVRQASTPCEPIVTADRSLNNFPTIWEAVALTCSSRVDSPCHSMPAGRRPRRHTFLWQLHKTSIGWVRYKSRLSAYVDVCGRHAHTLSFPAASTVLTCRLGPHGYLDGDGRGGMRDIQHRRRTAEAPRGLRRVGTRSHDLEPSHLWHHLRITGRIRRQDTRLVRLSIHDTHEYVERC